jgi:hypothetical protein
MLLLPVLQFFFVNLFTGSSSLGAAAFIIGALPVAPTVSVYGIGYMRAGRPDFVGDLSVATVLSTLAAVPVLFLCVISLQVRQTEIQDLCILPPCVLRDLCSSLALPCRSSRRWTGSCTTRACTTSSWPPPWRRRGCCSASSSAHDTPR